MLPDGLDWLSYLAGEGRGKAGKAKKKAAQGPSSHEVLSLVICKGAHMAYSPQKSPNRQRTQCAFGLGGLLKLT